MIFFILTILVSVFLLVFTVINLHKHQRSWIILFIAFFYSIWALSNFLYPRIENYEWALFFSKLIFSSTSIASWWILFFALHSPVVFKYKKARILILMIFGLWAIVEVYIAQFTDGIILYLEYSAELQHYIFHFNTPWYLHYVVYMCAVLFSSVGILFYKYKNSHGRTLLQLKYLFWGFSFLTIPASFTNMLLPMGFDIFQYSDLGPFFGVFALLTIAYSLMIDRLHDLRYLFHNLLFWGIKIFFIFFSILIFLLLSVKSLYGNYPQLQEEIIAGTLLISFALSYFTSRFDLRDALFGSRKVEKFLKLENKIAVELKLEKLGILISEYIRSALDVSDVLVLVFDQQNRDVIYRNRKGGFKEGKMLPTRDLLEVVEFWQKLTEEPILVKDELQRLKLKFEGKEKRRIERILYSMDTSGLEIIVPLNRKVVLNGLIVIGEKVDTLPFTIQDHDVLEKIIRIASVAFGRAILYQEVEEFTKTLQAKVDEQTKELRSRMESMEEMRQREKDLLDIMGHELRTPLTIARNSLELIDMHKAKQRKNKKRIKWVSDFQKQFDYIKAAIRREMGIVETLLSATKLDAKKMEIHITEVDLSKIVDTTLLGFEKEAVRKGLKVKVELNRKKKWIVKADSLQIQQVLDNLVSNAVKYTHKGFVRVSLKDLGKKVSLVISDSGEGMSKESIKKLGTKFFRLNQHIPSNGERGSEKGIVRPGGTGLGLYVAFGLVDLMGGTYTVESELGKGSTFTVVFKKA